MPTHKHELRKSHHSSAHARSKSKLYNSQKRSTVRDTIRVPNDDKSGSMHHFRMRNESDASKLHYRMESALIPDFPYKYKPNDAPDLKSREPSYTKFKVPYEIICAKRYAATKKLIDAQLEHEIRHNIDFQPTAAEACYFVRCMSYTTFWPPLHNMTELKHTGQNFFQLTPKETEHLKYIMNTDIT